MAHQPSIATSSAAAPQPLASPLSSSWSKAEEATQNICAGKGNFNHLWQLVGALCELGLSGLVEPVLNTIKIESPAWLAQRAAVLEQAKKLPSGSVPWESTAPRFAENIDALRVSNPAIDQLRDFWQNHQQRYSLFRAADGNYQVVDQQAPVIFAGFVGGLIDHRALTRHWTYECRGYQLPKPVAFDGAGYGWVLNRVLETTNRTLHNFSCAIYVIEPDLLSACVLLNLHDFAQWSHRLRFFAGPSALGQFQEALKQNQNWDIPANMVSERIAERPALDLQAAVATANQTRMQMDTARALQLNTHYSAIGIDRWASTYEAALAGKKRLKVLGLTSRYTTVLQYSMDELGEAIRAAGHEFILCKEPDDQCANVPELMMIHEHKPDLLVMISRLRSENPRLPKKVPCLSWDQDNLPCMRTDAAKAGLDAMTYVAGLGARLGYEQLGWPRENCILAFAAAATHRYHNKPASDSLLAKHRCTFSYTSNASGLPESMAKQLRQNYAGDAKLLAVFDAMTDEILTKAKDAYVWDTANVQRLLDSGLAANGVGLSPAARQDTIAALRSISDRAFRHVTLHWVAEYCRKNNKTLRIYGSGWDAHPEFANFAAGFLAPGEEMRAVFQASEINLQIIETGFMHSRVLDGLAAGGFFLYRLATEARDLDGTEKARLIMTRRAIETGCVTFGQLEASTDPLIVGPWQYARTVIQLGKPDERCRWLDLWEAAPSEETQFADLPEITFANQQQFNEMADRYLSSDELRQNIGGRLRQVVIDRFSYDARWKQFLTGISAGLNRAAKGKAADAMQPKIASAIKPKAA